MCRRCSLAWRCQASEHRRLICQGVTADAHAEPTALAGRPARRVRPLLHPADLPDLPSAGGRVLGPARPAHRHRHADRGGPGRTAPPRPGLPVVGNGPSRHRPAWGHRWVVVGVIVHLPFVTRAVCLPILARLWIPGDPDHTPLILARELLDLVCGHLGDRPVHLVGDAAYIGKPLQGLPKRVTVTARLRSDAALYAPPPPPTGRPGRPPVKGHRLPQLIVIAAMTRYQWTPVTVRCYGKTLQREVLAIGCLWYGALKAQPVQVVLSRPLGSPDGYQLALVTTDLAATPAQIIERYADRWSVETTFLDGRHLAGVGQARTRTKRSVERLVPFGLVCLSLAIIWYAHHGQPAADLAAHRARAPWYRTKHTISVADMLASLRRALLAAQYQHGHPDQHTLDLFPDALLTGLDPAA